MSSSPCGPGGFRWRCTTRFHDHTMRRALGSRCTTSLHLAAYIPTTKLNTRAAPAGKLCAVHHVLACLCDQGAPSVTPSRRRYDVRTLLWAARSRTKELRSSTFETLQQSIWRVHRVGGITLDRARTMLKPWDTLGRKRLGIGAKLTDLSTDLFIDPAQLQDPMRSAALDGLDVKGGMRKRPPAATAEHRAAPLRHRARG